MFETLIGLLGGKGSLILGGLLAIAGAILGLKLRSLQSQARTARTQKEAIDAQIEAAKIIEQIDRAASSGDAEALRRELLREPDNKAGQVR